MCKDKMVDDLLLRPASATCSVCLPPFSHSTTEDSRTCGRSSAHLRRVCHRAVLQGLLQLLLARRHRLHHLGNHPSDKFSVWISELISPVCMRPPCVRGACPPSLPGDRPCRRPECDGHGARRSMARPHRSHPAQIDVATTWYINIMTASDLRIHRPQLINKDSEIFAG